MEHSGKNIATESMGCQAYLVKGDFV